MSEPEMFDQINALVGAIGKAFDMTVDDTVKAIEAGQVSLSMKTDAGGQNYVEVDYRGRTAQIFHGAIRHAPSATAG